MSLVEYDKSFEDIEDFWQRYYQSLNKPKPTKSQIKRLEVQSDGSSADYYKIPAGATELQDLIEAKNMNFAIGNIFKACYRLGEKEDSLYDLNKIIFFAQRELERIKGKS